MKRSLVFALFYLCAPFLLAARTLQRFYMIDVSTGFHSEGFELVGLLITVGFFVFAVIELVLTWLTYPRRLDPTERSVGMAVGAFSAGACLLIAAAALVLTGKGVADTVMALADFAFALCLFWRGACLLTRLKFSPPLSLLSVVYFLIKLIFSFSAYAGEVTVTDTVFDILTMCALLLFFVADAKIIAGIGNNKTAVAFYGWGVSAAVYCLAAFFPSVVNLLFGNAFELHGGSLPDITYVGFAIYILASLNTAKEEKVNGSNNQLLQ